MYSEFFLFSKRQDALLLTLALVTRKDDQIAKQQTNFFILLHLEYTSGRHISSHFEILALYFEIVTRRLVFFFFYLVKEAGVSGGQVEVLH